MSDNPIDRAIEAGGFAIVEQLHLPGRAATLVEPPKLHPRVLTAISDRHPGGIYSHQALAIEALPRGEDVCLATATASGKSLVFLADERVRLKLTGSPATAGLPRRDL